MNQFHHAKHESLKLNGGLYPMKLTTIATSLALLVSHTPAKERLYHE